MDRGTVVGLSFYPGKPGRKQPELSYFGVRPSSTRDPVVPLGFCTPRARGIVGIAQSRSVTVFSTARTLWALRVPRGIHDSCHARRLVSLPANTRIAAFTLNSLGGLVYAANGGHRTVRGTLVHISRSRLRHLGFVV